MLTNECPCSNILSFNARWYKAPGYSHSLCNNVVVFSDKSFDIPDRTFHSIRTSWRLSSFESSTDVKELIPEFFFLPEFLVNNEGEFLHHGHSGLSM